MKVQLWVEDGEQKDEIISLEEGIHRIGRGKNTAVKLNAKYQAVSREHAELKVMPTGLSVRDLGSSLGTYVDGHRIDGDFQLANGQLLELGSGEAKASLRVQFQGGIDSETGVTDAAAEDESVIKTGFVGLDEVKEAMENGRLASEDESPPTRFDKRPPLAAPKQRAPALPPREAPIPPAPAAPFHPAGTPAFLGQEPPTAPQPRGAFLGGTPPPAAPSRSAPAPAPFLGARTAENPPPFAEPVAEAAAPQASRPDEFWGNIRKGPAGGGAPPANPLFSKTPDQPAPYRPASQADGVSALDMHSIRKIQDDLLRIEQRRYYVALAISACVLTLFLVLIILLVLNPPQK